MEQCEQRFAIYNLIQRLLNSTMKTCVTSVLCPVKPINPILGLLRCKTLQILLQTMISYLSICLRMICRTHFELGVHKMKYFGPEMTKENRVW